MRLAGPSTGRRVNASALVLTLVAATLAGFAGVPGATRVAAAGPACQASTAPAGYVVTVCIDTPLPGASLSGSRNVSATLNVSGTSPGFQRAIFTLDSSPLLIDYTSPYTFALDSRRWADGSHTLAVSALMRDGFTSTPATETVGFSNGPSYPLPNNGSFTPATPSPAPGAPLVVAATGDGAGGEPSAVSTANLIATWSPNMFLYLGDVYEKGRAMEFNNWYGAAGTSGTYGNFRAYTNPTIGNHEYEPDGAAGYFYYWDNIPHFYSYDAGGWHFISLDSTSQYNEFVAGTDQYNFLAADLAANSSACTLVYYHHPLFNVGQEGKTGALAPIWSLLAANHVTLVLNGHDHDYQRYEPLDGAGNSSPTGITEIVVGSGGHGHQSAVPGALDAAHLVASDFTSFGALKLNLYPSSAAFKFISTAGQVVDSGLVPCRNTVDSVNPGTPPGLTATPAGPSEIDVAWGAATDNVGIAGYDLFRDGSGTPLATLEPGIRTYADTAVGPGSTHSYTVVAFDAAGNRSTAAGPKQATTPNGTSTFNLNPQADAYTNTGSPGTNYGTNVSLRVGTTIFRSYLRFDLSGIVGTVQSATLRIYANSSQSTGYSVFGVANTTWGESTINATNQPPFNPTSGGASGPITAGTWTNVDVTSLVGSGGGLLSLGISSTGNQTNLASANSANKPVLVVTVGGGGGAQKPTAHFTASAITITAGLPVTFTDTSTGAPTSWHWTFDDGTSSSLQNPSHTWAQSGTYVVGMTATNAAGTSAPTTMSIQVNDDLAAPTTPPNLTANAVGQSEIDLAWGASSDNVAVTGYDIFRNGSGTPLATLGPSPRTYADTGLTAGTTYSYTVVAFDAAGNRSAAAGPATATTSGGGGSPTTVTVFTQADAYTNTGSPGTNYGTNVSLRVGTTIFRSYLRFDLSGIVGTVQSATLRIYANSSQSTGYSVFGVANTTWGESTINVTNQPPFNPTSGGTSGPITAGTWTSVDVTSLVGSGGGLLSLGISSTGNQTNLASANSANKPQLVVTYTP